MSIGKVVINVSATVCRSQSERTSSHAEVMMWLVLIFSGNYTSAVLEVELLSMHGRLDVHRGYTYTYIGGATEPIAMWLLWTSHGSLGVFSLHPPLRDYRIPVHALGSSQTQYKTLKLLRRHIKEAIYIVLHTSGCIHGIGGF